MNTVNDKRTRTNASIISMMQRFSDIFVMFCGFYIINLIDSRVVDSPLWLHMLTALVVFQMVGGITDFYRSWRGVNFGSELQLILQNWTISLVISAGLMSFVNVIYL